MQELDGPRTAQQELFFDLEDAAAILGWSVSELTASAERSTAPKEAILLMKMCSLLSAQQAKLRGYADEVKLQRIVRDEGSS